MDLIADIKVFRIEDFVPKSCKFRVLKSEFSRSTSINLTVKIMKSKYMGVVIERSYYMVILFFRCVSWGVRR